MSNDTAPWGENPADRATSYEGSGQNGLGSKVYMRVGNQTRGNAVLELAERLRPWLMKMFERVRDDNGSFMQPARVRGIAINVAQSIIKEDEGSGA